MLLLPLTFYELVKRVKGENITGKFCIIEGWRRYICLELGDKKLLEWNGPQIRLFPSLCFDEQMTESYLLVVPTLKRALFSKPEKFKFPPDCDSIS